MNYNIQEVVAKNIRLIRTYYEWRQQDLAETAGYSANTIKHAEFTSRVTGLNVITDIADAFELPVYVLFLPTKKEVLEWLIKNNK